jgi:hypothetical protein
VVARHDPLGRRSASLTEQVGAAQRLFDALTHRHGAPESSSVEAWQVVAAPGSATPLLQVSPGDLVVQRALGEGRLATTRVVGEDVAAEQLYGSDGLVRRDTLVLRRAHREAAAPWPSDAFEAEGEVELALEAETDQGDEASVALEPEADDQASVGLDPEAERAAEHDDAEAAPHPHHCFELSTHRAMDLTADGALTRPSAATATTPPRYALGAPTRFRTIAGLEANFPTELTPTANPTEFLATTRGRVLLDTGHLRVDPGNASRFQVRIRGLVCHPAAAAGSSELPAGSERFAVAIVVHGNHTALDVDLLDSGGPRRTVSVPTGSGSTTITLIPARATLRHEVPSYRGYRYLQEHLARMGIVSVSLDTNAANELGSLVRFRADLVLELLDHLRSQDATSGSPFHRRLDFERVALVGHSRGGDAVAMAAELNRLRSSTTKYGLRAVVAIAPTDFTGMLEPASRLRMRSDRTASFLCVYGSHDGDVSGAFDPADLGQGWGFAGTGFRHYDRASTQRAMVFIHGATHNRFNRVWIDPAAHAAGSPARRLAESQADNSTDEPTVDPRRPSSTAFPVPAGHRDARVLSDTAHQTLANEYVGGWLALWLLGQYAEQRRFIGDQANSLGVAVGLEWKLGRSIRGVDDFDDTAPGTNVLGGATSSPVFVRERLIELSDLAHVPHHDRLLEAGPPTGAILAYRSEIPPAKRDWTNFTALTFRISKHFPDLSSPTTIGAAAFPPNLQLTLHDGTHRATVDHTVIAPLNPRTERPYHRLMGALNLTKIHLQTWQVPLSRWSGVTLSAIEAIEITFGATAGEPIHLDTLTLVRI